MFSFFRNRRRRKWLAKREPNEWGNWLRQNVWQYEYLAAEQVRRVHQFVCILFHEKSWSGGGELVVTDEMRVTIAGQAAILTLGFGKPYYFDRLLSIIVYPNAYQGRPEPNMELLLGQHNDSLFGFDIRLGEAWQGGPIILSWNAVLEDGRSQHRKRSLVVHEFAHHMDGLDGQTDGSPPITDYEFEKRWYRITNQEFEQLTEMARRGRPSLLDHYGAENHAEFFAVATECFFTCPHALSKEHADLFAILERLFGQNPCKWIPPVAKEKNS